MKKVFWLLPLLAMLATGCLKENQEGPQTIVPMGTEADVKPIEQMGIDTLLHFLNDISILTLPTGNIPPDIQGECVLTPLELIAYNADHPVPGDSLYLRFGGEPSWLIIQVDTTSFDTVPFYPNGQNNRTVPCDIKGDVMEKGNVFNMKHIDKGFVMGHDDVFTVYFIVKYNCEYMGETGNVEFELTRGYVITGMMTTNGIDQVVVACVNINVTTTDPTVQAMKNHIYIYRKGNA